MKPLIGFFALLVLAALHAVAQTPAPAASAADFMEMRHGRFNAIYEPLPTHESNRLAALVNARIPKLALAPATRAELWKLAGQQEIAQKLERPARLAAPATEAQDPPNYQVYVPADYLPGRLFGLLVWNSPTPRGDIPESYKAVCDRHHLIWFAPSNVGNYRYSPWRVYMPLEAQTQARRRFTIDPQRVYVAGMSGGGRISSRAALFFSDTFNGAIYIIGCDYYRNVPAANHPGQSWSGFWPMPDVRLINRAKLDSRIVILEGSKDPNLDDSTDFYAAYQKDGFKHLTWLEVPDMGHTIPPGDWFEKAAAALDEPLPAADAIEKRAKGFEQIKNAAETYLTNARLALLEGETPRGSQAQNKADAIYQEFVQQVALIRAQINGGASAAEITAIPTLRAKYGMLVADLAPDVEALPRTAAPLKRGS